MHSTIGHLLVCVHISIILVIAVNELWGKKECECQEKAFKCTILLLFRTF